MNTMLVMADLIRLMGLATPIAVDVESMYFVAEGWELIDLHLRANAYILDV